MNEFRFYRVAAVCSLLSAVTTLLLIFLPEFFAPVRDFEGRMARVHDPIYRLRAWVYLLHPFLVVTAALAVANEVRRHAPVLGLFGALGFLLWASTEAAQSTLTLFAFDEWRVAWATADAAARESIRIWTGMYDGIWDAMYVLLLIGFAIGNLLLGCSLVRRRGLTRVVGAFLLGAFALTLMLFVGELGAPAPDTFSYWSYPAIQPLGRALVGVWLWRVATGRRAHVA